jgi:hypothetical protein
METLNRTEQFTFQLHPTLTQWKKDCLFLSNLRCTQANVKVEQVWTGPEGFRRLRLQDFRTSAHEGGKVVSPTHRSPLPPVTILGT